jgi:hypothetical protein
LSKARCRKQDLESEFLESEFFESEFLESEFLENEFLESEFLESEFLESEFLESEFLKRVFLKREFLESEFLESKFLESEFLESELFVCLFVTMHPAGTQMYLRIILAQFLQVSINNSSTRSTLPTGLGQNPTGGPTATHHLSLPGLRYQTLLTIATCHTSSPVEV